MSAPDPEAWHELDTLVGGVRSFLEQLKDSGADEIPFARNDGARERESPAKQAVPARSLQAPPPRRDPPMEPPPPSGDGRSVRAPVSVASVTSAPPRTVAPSVVAAPKPSPKLPVLSGGVDPIAKRVRLEEIARDVAACTKCVLHATRTQTVFARGNPDSELMFIGEGPGADEDAQGLPFVGKAGQLLDKMIIAMGYAPDDVYIANIVKCRPPGNRKPTPEEMSTCEGYLHAQIALVQPKVIVALGATAVEGLLKVSGITKLRGTWRLYRGEIPVMPTFHPAYLLRSPGEKRFVWDDLKQVMGKLGKKPPG